MYPISLCGKPERRRGEMQVSGATARDSSPDRPPGGPGPNPVDATVGSNVTIDIDHGGQVVDRYLGE
jgi:hypothetical protein